MIYMDNAATSFPKPMEVIEKVAECIAVWCANPGRSGYDLAMNAAEAVHTARKEVASLIGENVSPNEIIFTENCTGAANLALKGILKPGDHVITTMMEHNSILRPLYALKGKGIETSLLKCDTRGYPEKGSLEKALKRNTKMIICTLSSNVTGTIMPVEEMGAFAEKHGLLFLIDACQGMGSIELPENKAGARLLIASGHKSLLGPQGTGFLYADSNVELCPVKEGGTGTQSLELRQPSERPEGMESGTLNVPGIAGLCAGIQYIKKRGISEIRKKEVQNMEYLQQELAGCRNLVFHGPAEPADRSSILAFNIEGMECEEAAEILNRDYNIAVRAGYHCAPMAHRAIGTAGTGCVRLSPGLFTSEEELKKTADAIRAMAEGKSSSF